jgi:hypothetical protein
MPKIVSTVVFDQVDYAFDGLIVSKKLRHKFQINSWNI